MPKSEIKLPVDLSGDNPVFEILPAEEIAPNHFRITASPGFASGVASGDEIELYATEKGYRILRRSGNICVQLFLADFVTEKDSFILELITSIGGWLDGGTSVNRKSGRLLIITIPVAVGFKKIEGVMSEIKSNCNVDSWMYGNVYDADGMTPLNWWNNPLE
jgi:hypothetical protein